MKNSLVRLKHPWFKILIEVRPGDIHLIQIHPAGFLIFTRTDFIDIFFFIFISIPTVVTDNIQKKLRSADIKGRCRADFPQDFLSQSRKFRLITEDGLFDGKNRGVRRTETKEQHIIIFIRIELQVGAALIVRFRDEINLKI